jgi:hypothetical protein
MEDYYMIVKSTDNNRKEFLGISFEELAVGEKSMVTKMNFYKGDIVQYSLPEKIETSPRKIKI